MEKELAAMLRECVDVLRLDTDLSMDFAKLIRRAELLLAKVEHK